MKQHGHILILDADAVHTVGLNPDRDFNNIYYMTPEFNPYLTKSIYLVHIDHTYNIRHNWHPRYNIKAYEDAGVVLRSYPLN